MGSTPPSSALHDLRQQALRGLLRILSVAMAVPYVYFVVRLVSFRHYGEVAVLTGMYACVGGLAVAPIPYPVRSRLFIALLFTVAVLEILLQGFGSFPLLLGLTCSVLAVLYLGLVESLVVLGIWLLTLAFLGHLIDTGLYVPPVNIMNAFSNKAVAQPLIQLSVALPLLLSTNFLVARLQTEVTARRRAFEDLEQAQASLRSSEQLRTLGLVAGGVAHDLNNTLTVILTEAEMIASPQESRAAIVEAATSGAHLSSQLLGVTGESVMQSSTVDLFAALRPTLVALRKILPPGIRLEIGHPPAELPATVDPAMLQHALLNIALNARDAMADGGSLTVTFERVKDEAQVRVVDTGHGMDAETLERACDPFFTTKGPGKGTGLGLANVNRTVRDLGGTLTLTSSVGEGTAVTLRFPVAHAPLQSLPVARSVPPGRGQRILLVEDDLRVRAAVAETLSNAAYSVRDVACVAEARRALEESEDFDLLLTDLALPDGSGANLAREVTTTRRDLRVLLVSGFAPTVADREALAAHEFTVLKKPFSPEQLRHAVSRAFQ